MGIRDKLENIQSIAYCADCEALCNEKSCSIVEKWCQSIESDISKCIVDGGEGTNVSAMQGKYKSCPQQIRTGICWGYNVVPLRKGLPTGADQLKPS